MSVMINTLLKSQEYLLTIAQEDNNIDLVEHILETPFFYKGYGIIQVSDVKVANKILVNYIDEFEWKDDFYSLFSTSISLNHISKSYYFNNEDFKKLLTELFLSPDVKLKNVAIFENDID